MHKILLLNIATTSNSTWANFQENLAQNQDTFTVGHTDRFLIFTAQPNVKVLKPWTLKFDPPFVSHVIYDGKGLLGKWGGMNQGGRNLKDWLPSSWQSRQGFIMGVKSVNLWHGSGFSAEGTLISESKAPHCWPLLWVSLVPVHCNHPLHSINQPEFWYEGK